MATPAECEAAMAVWARQHGYEWTGPYLGSGKPRKGMCAKGHQIAPRWNDLQQGSLGCRACAGQDPAIAESRMDTWAQQHGYEWTELYPGAGKPRKGLCDRGHQIAPRWAALQRGSLGCRTCAGQDPAVTESKMDTWAEKNGYHWIEPYPGSGRPRRGVCAVGHEVAPRWSDLNRGQGGCQACEKRDPVVAEAEMDRWAVDNGYTWTEPYPGSGKPRRGLCPRGHEVSPYWDNLKQGVGGCARCSGRVWDKLYVVVNQALGRVKFGVTSGDPTPRLRNHRSVGYKRTERIVSIEQARILERQILTTLSSAGLCPIYGKEYFDVSALALILDVVDGQAGVDGSAQAA